MTDMDAPATLPMGRLSSFEVGPKRLTIQTEFYPKPGWRLEIRVYLGGTIKKTYAEDLSTTSEIDLQAAVDRLHDARCAEILAGLRRISS